jgi:hypothetical protein
MAAKTSTRIQLKLVKEKTTKNCVVYVAAPGQGDTLISSIYLHKSRLEGEPETLMCAITE